MGCQELFERLSVISALGSPGWKPLEDVSRAVSELREWLYSEGDRLGQTSAGPPDDGGAGRRRMRTSVDRLLSLVDVAPSDVRLECGCLAVVVLQEVVRRLDEDPPRTREQGGPTGGRRRWGNQGLPAPPNLVSLQQTKVAEDAFRVTMYTAILACLGPEASQYVKITVAKNKFVLGQDLLVVPQNCQHDLLAAIMKILLPVVKHASLGVGPRRSLLPEIMASLLELCFAPTHVKTHPEDTGHFRLELEDLLSTMDRSLTLRHFMLLLGTLKGSVWLRRTCGSFVVRRFLMQEGGVEAVALAGLSICDARDSRHCEAVARLIAGAETRDVGLLYARLGPQLLELIGRDDVKPEAFRVLSLVLAQLAERSAGLTALHVTTKLLKPLMDTTASDSSSCEGSNLTRCVGRVHKLAMDVPPPSAALNGLLLRPVLKPLMGVASLATTHLRTLARQLIVRYVSQLESHDDAVESLLVLSGLQASSHSPPVNPALKFSVDDEGGVRVVSRTGGPDEDPSPCVVWVLEALGDPGVVRSFYGGLARRVDFSRPTDRLEALRAIEATYGHLQAAAESERLAEDLFGRPADSLPFVRSLLESSRQECGDAQLARLRDSMVASVLALVAYYAGERSLSGEMTRDDWEGLSGLLPSLERAAENEGDGAVPALVRGLRELVLSRGVVRGTGAKSPTTKGDETRVAAEDTETKVVPEDTETKVVPEEPGPRSTYEEAMEDLLSPEVPIRGHALLSLRRLVEGRDEETTYRRERVFQAFRQNVAEDDSYLYLMAIEGLAALADAFPDKVVETLTMEFGNGSRGAEERSKLAEALTRATRRLGALLPHYKQYFINAFLNGVRDEEAIVRTASLSALGDVCKLLRFSVGPIIHEIFSVLHHVIKNDPSEGARCASLLVVTLLLRGLGADAFTVLGGDVTRDLYRALRLVHHTTRDDKVRLHAQLAIEEVDVAARRFLLPKVALTKRIYVADVPPGAL